MSPDWRCDNDQPFDVRLTLFDLAATERALGLDPIGDSDTRQMRASLLANLCL